MGGIILDVPLAIMKLPAHTAMVSKASPIPVYVFFFVAESI